MDLKKIEALSDYIKANQRTPFQWGVFDCCVLIAKVIEIQTGIDLYKPYKGKYKTEKGAQLALKKYGSVESALDQHFEQISPNFMQRGDVAMMEDGVMAFRFGNSLISTTDNGLYRIRGKVKTAWRII